MKNTLFAASLALTLVGAGGALAASADINNGAYTDPSASVRQGLAKEHLYLGHPNAVRSPGQKAFASEPRTYSAPVWNAPAIGRDLSIRSQSGNDWRN